MDAATSCDVGPCHLSSTTMPFLSNSSTARAPGYVPCRPITFDRVIHMVSQLYLHELSHDDHEKRRTEHVPAKPAEVVPEERNGDRNRSDNALERDRLLDCGNVPHRFAHRLPARDCAGDHLFVTRQGDRAVVVSDIVADAIDDH